MNIGNGQNEVTDNDLIKDGSGTPYIPGSTITGVFRSVLPEEYQPLFGTVDNLGIELDKNEQPKIEASQIILYDARMKEKDYNISVRDSVALDEYKTAIPGAKFDFEVLEPGVIFETWLEQNIEESDRDIPEEQEIGYLIAKQWEKGHIHFGSKGSRGLGQTKLLGVKRAEFIWDENGINQWLDFDMYEEEGWTERNIEELADSKKQKENILEILLSLKQEGGISIRRYVTSVKESVESEGIDYKQMSYLRGKKEIPVIPGTSWAGAFRHHINRITADKFKEYFGSTEQKSRIFFSESEITGATQKVLTHNAIDRFTGGTIDGALYTEKTWFGGKTKLKIQIDTSKRDIQEKDIRKNDIWEKNAKSQDFKSDIQEKDSKKKDIRKNDAGAVIENEFYAALAAAILDLHVGILSIGGLTSIGRGLFSIEKIQINGEEIPVAHDADTIAKMHQNLTQKLMEGGCA